MENILFKRHKTLITGILVALLLTVFLFIFFSFYFQSDIQRGFQTVNNGIAEMENSLKRRIDRFRDRAEYLFQKQQKGTLRHGDFGAEESLIETEQGVIRSYQGAVHFFRNPKLDNGHWQFIRQDSDIFFVYRPQENRLYIRYFCDQENNRFLDKISLPTLLKELRFLEPGKRPANSTHIVRNKQEEIYHIRRMLKHANSQLQLFLKFSKNDFSRYIEAKASRFRTILFIFILLVIAGILTYIYQTNGRLFKWKRRWLVYMQILLAILLFYSLYTLISQIVQPNLDLSILGFKLDSVHQLFVILLFLTLLLLQFSRNFKPGRFFMIPINILFPLLLLFVSTILKNSTIPISNFMFEIDYLVMITSLFLVFMAPFILIRDIRFGSRKRDRIFLIGSQALFLLLYVLVLKIDFRIAAIYILSLFLIIFFRHSDIIRKVLYVVITATLISIVINNSFDSLKREFVSSNLKRIFLNQENYSKLVIGEIIEEFELSEIGLKSFFEEDKRMEAENILADIWNRSLASKEEIASGIYILDKDKNVISQFSFKIPYLKTTPTLELPVWTTEESVGTLYGKELSVSFGSIKVNDNAQHLGYIMIQVLNSPEMILRNSGLTIFGLDKKLKNAKLNYLKLKGNKIVENPLNINLKNLVEISQYRDEWFHFTFLENRYEGYRFISGDHSIIIFSPKKGMIERLAEIIKMFVLFLFMIVILSFNEIKRETFRFLYYSLSSRIFIILIFLSLVSIILFSVFTLNYNVQTIQRSFRNEILKKGRIAQNLIGQILDESNELIQNDVFFLANILGNDIHVYADNELFFSSNYKQIYNLKIPKHIHSNTVEMFGNEKQSYYIEGERDRYNLFFKLYRYIFCINFSFSENDHNYGKDRNIDFIITLFFLLLLGSLIIVIFVRNKIMAPILFLNENMSAVEKGDLKRIENEPVEIELKTLYSGFNSMVQGIEEQKKNASDLARMKTVVKLGRRVAHEVKNPLTPIKLSAEQILRSIDDKKENYENLIRKSVKYIVTETDHLKKVAHGFLDLSHIDDMHKEECDIVRLVEDQVVFFKQSYPSIHFVVEEGIEGIRIRIDRLKISQLLKNIMINAIEAINREDGRIRIRIMQVDSWVQIEISDNGVGINEEDIALLFEEDYSTKEVGSGIGLFISKRIVEQHGGQIEIAAEAGGGTVVKIRLPLNVSSGSDSLRGSDSNTDSNGDDDAR